MVTRFFFFNDTATTEIYTLSLHDALPICHYVGYSEDSKVAAEFDITPYLKKGENLIAFQSFRWCDGTYCEDQDFWRMSGVGRDCWLYARDAKHHIDNVKVTPDLVDNYANGTLSVDE